MRLLITVAATFISTVVYSSVALCQIVDGSLQYENRVPYGNSVIITKPQILVKGELNQIEGNKKFESTLHSGEGTCRAYKFNGGVILENEPKPTKWLVQFDIFGHINKFEETNSTWPYDLIKTLSCWY